jgi:peptidoglycan hydrolase-like protein with peptidoglycan-binding domain
MRIPVRGLTILGVAAVLLAGTVLIAPPATATWAPWVTVQRGDSGLKVRAVQALLREHGYDVVVSGHFRAGTEKAVKRFQDARGIHVTGVVDKTTWPTLVVVLRRGDAGQAVAVVQRALSFLGFYDAVVGGHFGPRTEAAVKRFQDNWELAATGVVNVVTWRYLLATVGSPSCLMARCDE